MWILFDRHFMHPKSCLDNWVLAPSSNHPNEVYSWGRSVESFFSHKKEGMWNQGFHLHLIARLKLEQCILQLKFYFLQLNVSNNEIIIYKLYSIREEKLQGNLLGILPLRTKQTKWLSLQIEITNPTSCQ